MVGLGLLAGLLVMIRSVVVQDYPLLLISFILITFMMIIVIRPDQMINLYIWITFCLLGYRYFIVGDPLLILNSVKDSLLLIIWGYIFLRGLTERSGAFFSSWRWKKYNVISLSFFIYYGLEILRAPGLKVGILGFRKTAEFLSIFWLAQLIYVKKAQIKTLEKNLVAVGIATACFGIFQKMGDIYLDRGVVKLGEIVFRRITSTYGNPNTFAIMMVTVVLLILNRYLSKEKGEKTPRGWLPSTLVLIGAFLFAYSVSGLAGLITGALLLFFSHQQYGYFRKILIVGIVGAVLVSVVFFTPLYYGRIMRLQRRAEDPRLFEQLSRYRYWNEALEQWKRSPLLGISFGKMGGTIRISQETMPVVDNSYMLILVNSGLIGSILFAALLISIYYQGFINSRELNDKYLKMVSRSWVTILFTYCGIAVVANLWQMLFPINFLFWLGAGIIVKLPQLDSPLPKIPRPGGEEGQNN